MSKVNIPKLKYIILPDETNKDKLEEIKKIIAQSLLDYYEQKKREKADN